MFPTGKYPEKKRMDQAYISSVSVQFPDNSFFLDILMSRIPHVFVCCSSNLWWQPQKQRERIGKAKRESSSWSDATASVFFLNSLAVTVVWTVRFKSETSGDSALGVSFMSLPGMPLLSFLLFFFYSSSSRSYCFLCFLLVTRKRGYNTVCASETAHAFTKSTFTWLSCLFRDEWNVHTHHIVDVFALFASQSLLQLYSSCLCSF